MLFVETFNNDDDETCYDIDIATILAETEHGAYKYKYDIVEFEDLNETDDFLEYCIETLGEEDDEHME